VSRLLAGGRRDNSKSVVRRRGHRKSGRPVPVNIRPWFDIPAREAGRLECGAQFPVTGSNSYLKMAVRYRQLAPRR
jgi:hypothetical protein